MLMDYEQMAKLEESILNAMDPETLSDLEKDLSKLMAHTAVTAIHQYEKLKEKERQEGSEA